MPRQTPTFTLHQPPFADTLPSPLYVRVAPMPAGAAYPEHRHDWGEFVHSYQGTMEVQLADSHYLIPPQYGLWLPPRVRHRGLNRQEAVHCSLYVAPELAAALPRQACSLTVNPLLQALLETLRMHPPMPPYSAAQERLLKVVVDQLEVAQCAGSYLPSTDDPLLLPVLQALQNSPGDERSMADWATAVHTTERTLARRCQRVLGMTLGEWRQRLRVVKAMRLLEAGLAVEVVAQDLGYASTSSFIVMFQRHVGATPDAYRRGGAKARVPLP